MKEKKLDEFELRHTNQAYFANGHRVEILIMATDRFRVYQTLDTEDWCVTKYRLDTFEEYSYVASRSYSMLGELIRDGLGMKRLFPEIADALHELELLRGKQEAMDASIDEPDHPF